MRGLVQDDAAFAADAYLAWWSLAGIQDATGEAPVNWLRPVALPTPPRDAPHAADPVVVEKPETLESFHTWIATDHGQPERRWPGAAILPTGPAKPRLMVVTDLPDISDMAMGTVLSDRSGALFDAMLRSIGHSRESVYLASLFLARPPGGMMETADIETAVIRMRLHVALVQPDRLLLLGDRTVRALLPTSAAMDADGLPRFNHDGGTVPAVATFHPRLLLTQSAAKAECWRTLQRLIEENHP